MPIELAIYDDLFLFTQEVDYLAQDLNLSDKARFKLFEIASRVSDQMYFMCDRIEHDQQHHIILNLRHMFQILLVITRHSNQGVENAT